MRESGEDYLETIYLLGKKTPGVHAIDIAHELGYSKPSITKAMKILKEDGFIIVDEYNHIVLTETGLAKAQQVYEKHQYITKFWILNGVDADIAAKDACRMEHDISAETFACIKSFVDKTKL